ncbi:hypothetical protein [Halogranum rubrum]|uniref:Uncharacterized protein n=1 Tax=Halogranum salarium B-1 TaxID=1210908 RepID=J3JHR3_9EURY|nr:hypothetical protein [Halogranum salarium]EJN61206.1 hypothetical protein HSB1_02470 [Halogranum salarium B-1]
MRRLSPSTQSTLTLLASILVAAGSVLPWLRVNPAHTGPVINIYLAGMDSGLDLWGLVLVPAVLALGVLHAFDARPISDLTTLLVGCLSVGLVTLYWQSAVGGYFVPDVGWYVALAGSLLLLTVGVQRVWSHMYYEKSKSDELRSV